MNCEDFENNVNDLAREQLMEAGIRAEALVHRDECAACAERLAEESALSFKLRVLAADVEAGEVPVLGEKVLAALRERQSPLVVETRRRFRVWAIAATASAAVAALILVAIAVGFMRARSAPSTASSPSNPGTQDEPRQKNIEKDHQLVVGIQLIDKPAQKLGSGITRRNKRALNRTAVPAIPVARGAHKNVAEPSVTVSYSIEVATDFFPIGYSSAPNLGDGGQLVRVELPRSAMLSMGLPVNMDRYGERVKADVFVGDDGLARAIRFVQ